MKKNLFLSLIIGLSFQVAAQNDVQLDLAIQYYEDKDYEKAVSLFEKSYKNNSQFSTYRYYFNTLLALNDFGAAEKLVKKNIKKNAKDVFYQIDLGYLFQKTGELKKAQVEYQKAINLLNPDETQIAHAANTFLNYEQIEWAIKTYIAGNQLIESTTYFALELADLYQKNNEHIKAIAQYLEYIVVNPGNTQLVKNKLQESLQTPAFFLAFKNELLLRIQKEQNTTNYSELLIWAYIQKKDFNGAFIQTKALDKRQNENGYRVLALARSAKEEKEYDAAIKAYSYILDKGKSNSNYLVAKQELLRTRKEKITSGGIVNQQEIKVLNDDYASFVHEFGLNRYTAGILLDQANLQAFYLYQVDTAITIVEELMNMPQLDKNFKGQVKLSLADFYLIQGDVYEPVLLYTQVEKEFKDQPTAELARFKNAKLSYYKADFEWAQAQLSILKSATSELVANDALKLSVFIIDNLGLDTTLWPMEMYAKADLLYYQNKADEALLVLDSIINIYPNHSLADDILYFKAKILLSQQKQNEAVKQLEKIIAIYPQELAADDALFLLADLQEFYFKDYEKAQQLYENLLLNYKNSIFSTEARKRFRKLRGDLL